MLRRPAAARADRPAFLERIQKNVRYRRIDVAGAGIPLLGRDFGDPRMQPQRDCLAGVVHRVRSPQPISKVALTSTATPPGNELLPTAARACLPASPNTSTIRS